MFRGLTQTFIDTTPKILLAAVHSGPYLSIHPLEKEFTEASVSYLTSGISLMSRAKNGLSSLNVETINDKWGGLEEFLVKGNFRAIIRSSSEGVEGQNVETLVSRAAFNISMPLFVVEDFPGNFRLEDQQRLDLLFVEDQSIARLHEIRGVDPKRINAVVNPRYTKFANMDPEPLRYSTRSQLGLSSETVMLWAGQPDGTNSYRALERLLSNFPKRDATLLFRAHPRDPIYRMGDYQKLIEHSPLKILDVSDIDDISCLYCSADLVVTQFSSAAVEASHLGIPAVFLLFDDLGKEYLKQHKGYDSLPWSHNDCSFIIESESDASVILETALFDHIARTRIVSNFKHRFGRVQHSAKTIAAAIKSEI